MRKLIFFLLITANGLAQNPANSGLTVSQIDSIALAGGRAGVAEGNITSEKIVIREDKKKVVKGEGRSSIAIYLYRTTAFSRLLKGEYHRDVRYQDNSTENVSAHFYYNEKQLFQIRITETIVDTNGEKIKEHAIDVGKMDSLKNEDFLFTTNIRKWIVQLDAEILKLSKNTNK